MPIEISATSPVHLNWLMNSFPRLFKWLEMFAWPSGVSSMAFCLYDMALETSAGSPVDLKQL